MNSKVQTHSFLYLPYEHETWKRESNVPAALSQRVEFVLCCMKPILPFKCEQVLASMKRFYNAFSVLIIELCPLIRNEGENKFIKYEEYL